MTKEEAKEFIVQSVKDNVDIAKVADAIQTLEQQSTDAKTYLKRREENYVEYNVEWFLKNWEIELEIISGGKIKPTDADCISRQAVLDLTGKSDWFESSDDYNDFVCAVCNLPSVTPQPKVGKWIAQDIHNCHTDFKCSACGYIHRFMHIYGEPTADYTYCPNCGAKMVEPQESEEV